MQTFFTVERCVWIRMEIKPVVQKKPMAISALNLNSVEGFL